MFMDCKTIPKNSGYTPSICLVSIVCQPNKHPSTHEPTCLSISDVPFKFCKTQKKTSQRQPGKLATICSLTGMGNWMVVRRCYVNRQWRIVLEHSNKVGWRQPSYISNVILSLCHTALTEFSEYYGFSTGELTQGMWREVEYQSICSTNSKTKNVFCRNAK